MLDLKKLLLLAPILLFLLATSCNDDDNTEPADDLTTNCPFVQNDADNDGLIDDNESQIMDDCMSNALTSTAEVEANLIGNWTLVGHGEGWIPNRSQPCANLSFTADSLMLDFENLEVDTLITTSWNVVVLQGGVFLLDTPYQGGGADALWLTNFCEEYMFLNHTPSDGNMYIYQKVD